MPLPAGEPRLRLLKGVGGFQLRLLDDETQHWGEYPSLSALIRRRGR